MRRIILASIVFCTFTGAQAANDVFAWDTNKDGVLSSDEHAAGARTMYAAMDSDLDDSVTAAEMTASHEAVTGEQAKADELSSEEKIAVIDTNKDGVLSATEHAEGSRAMFNKMDKDVSGTLSQEELDAGHEELKKK
jgi:hypothetical protein